MANSSSTKSKQPAELQPPSFSAPNPYVITDPPERVAETEIQFERDEQERSQFESAVKLLNETQFSGRPDAPFFARQTFEIGEVDLTSNSTLNWLHVETLLDQAADILDRALNTRQRHDELSSKMFNLLLELREFVALDTIHSTEVSAGLYEVPYHVAVSELNAEHKSMNWNTELANGLRGLADKTFTGPNYERLHQETVRGSKITGTLPYTFKEQELDAYLHYEWYGSNVPIADHAVTAAVAQFDHSTEYSYLSLFESAAVFDSAADVARSRIQGFYARAAFADLNRNFLRSRTRVARHFQDLKLQATTDPNGVLNYSKRLQGVWNRLTKDVEMAIERLEAVRKGLAQVYGYDVDLPDRNVGVDDYLDRLVGWVRSAIHWLIVFADSDQSVVFPVSLKDKLTDSQWVEGIAQGTWEFEIGEIEFPRFTHIRLRGISASVVGRDDVVRKCPAPKRTYRFELMSPPVGRSLHNSGVTTAIDHSKVPPVLLGRVRDRESRRLPDVVGVAATHNVCPCGVWRLKLHGGTPSHELLSDFVVDVSDVVIDFHISFNGRIEGDKCGG